MEEGEGSAEELLEGLSFIRIGGGSGFTGDPLRARMEWVRIYSRMQSRARVAARRPVVQQIRLIPVIHGDVR